ncbi:MAG: type II secretion system protein [Planctomycetes bacterium]|nr:type II secretion system protein [Planctomycetota bacterium]
MLTPPQLHAHSKARAGLTLVELMMVMVVLTVAVSMLAGSMSSAARLGPVQRENALAGEGARRMLETLRGQPFMDIYALYNADPSDDPGGAGTAPGSGFAIQGLEPLADDADGLPGEILFPTQTPPLFENGTWLELGLPRDLDLDGVIDATDHSDDYQILPIEVRIRWRGVNGARSLSLYTQFVEV